MMVSFSRSRLRLGAFLQVLALLPSCLAVSSLQIDTTVGTVNGMIESKFPNVAQFLGIPYAEPPVGPLRWAAPLPKSAEATIDATKYAPSCPQLPDPGPDLYTVDVTEFNIPGPMSEDCLHLNVWAPYRKHSHKLPVLVWIFGGGFQSGGLDVPYQIPTQWVERSQSHIVVAIKYSFHYPLEAVTDKHSYRLNIFGFPNAADQPSNMYNLGLLDQRLAIEWVQSNIASFGGDASKITLWGQSAGGGSVDYYNFAYAHDPIVRGLIMDSGTALNPTLMANDPTHTSFTTIAKNFDCEFDSNVDSTAESELECMRNINATDIVAFLGTGPSVNFSPVADGIVVFSNYTARALAGNYTRLPAIIGSNSNDGASLIAYSPEGVNKTDADYTTLSHFTCPAVQTTKDRYASGAATFRYLYAGNFTNVSPRAWEGAYHASELPMVMGTSAINRGANTEFETAVSEAMQDMWLAFVESGPAGLNRRKWHAYKPGGMVLEFGKEGKVLQPLKDDDFQRVCDGALPVPGATSPQ